MPEKIKINIKIIHRDYPMQVAPEDETRVRGIAKMINERVSEFRKIFNTDDPETLLAMVAFDCLNQQKESDEGLSNARLTNVKQLRELNTILSRTLVSRNEDDDRL
ncbi:MAG: cell division protein ZapA [Cytophagales bacterium]|nr:cell division protein ZapA [Cytophagales bacterium]